MWSAPVFAPARPARATNLESAPLRRTAWHRAMSSAGADSNYSAPSDAFALISSHPTCMQKKVDLNQPLDADVKPTLVKTNLAPQYAEAALTLHGDYYRQLQSKCNRHILWHPASVATVVAGLAVATSYVLWDLIVVLDSLEEFYKLLLNNKALLTGIFPALILIVAVLGLISFLVSDDFRTISDELGKPANIQVLFGFDLTKYAKLKTGGSPKEEKLLKTGSDNTHLVVYRDLPIAVVTVKPLYDNSTDASFFVKITGLHVRKVFAKVDFDTLLLEWAVARSKDLFDEYVKAKKYKSVEGCKITLLIDGYSFDKDYIPNKERAFSVVSESYGEGKVFGVLPQQLLNLFFGVSKRTYAMTLVHTKEQ